MKTAEHGKIFREGNLRAHYHVGAIRRGLNGGITAKTATFLLIVDRDPFLPTQSGWFPMQGIFCRIEGRFNAKG